MDQSDKQQETDLYEAFYKRVINGLTFPAVNYEDMKKSILKEENLSSVKSFIGPKGDREHCFVTLQSTTSCSISLEPPTMSSLKKKTIAFIKTGDEYITKASELERLICIEIGKSVFKQMLNMLSEVMVPVLNNPQNQSQWTELISKDLMEKLNSYIAQLFLTIGQTQGLTMLPLPPARVMTSQDISDKDKAHIFENSIITWTKQIKNVLKMEPEMVFKQNEDPSPTEEVKFWSTKAYNLNSIYDQLKKENVATILKTLREVSSTYTTPFEKLRKEIRAARREANDNFKYLSTLNMWFDRLDNSSDADFVRLHELFIPIMHLILLINTHSKHYNTASRIVVLIREICNSIIKKAMNYIPADEIRNGIGTPEAVPETCAKLQTAIDVCTKFKDAYFDYKTKSEGKWKFPPNALFIRLDSFLERCHDILNITNTINQFNKLKGIQIGGTKGKNLTDTVQVIFNEFNGVVDDFSSVTEEIMDIKFKKFDDIFYKFRDRIKELERRLASVITQAFDDNDTISGQFKILETFDGLLNRPIIQDELEKKHIVLIESYKSDLKCVQNIFFDNQTLMDEMNERAPIYLNMPPVSGTLTWTYGLRERIKEPLEKLSNISPAIADKEEYKDVQKLYSNITQKLLEYENQKVLAWEKEVMQSTDEKLNLTLLFRNENDKTLKVNFDPALVRLLREVKYFKQLGLKIPENASLITEDIYSKGEMYRKQINKLDLIVFMYNTIVTTLNNVEEPLVRDKIVDVDGVLEPGIIKYKWKGTDIGDFIIKAHSKVEIIYKIACKMKDDLHKIKGLLEGMNKPMIYPQSKAKATRIEEFLSNHSSFFSNISNNTKNQGSIINKTIKEIWEAVKVDKKSNEWNDYQNFINDIVITGISTAICTSMSALNDMIDMKKIRDSVNPPILSIDMQLAKTGVIYEPEISENTANITVRRLIRMMEADFISLGILIKRIDTGGSGDYLVELKDNLEIRESMACVTGSLDLFEDETLKFRKTFQEYEQYWINDPEAKFLEFLESAENEQKTEEVEDATLVFSDEKNPIMEGVKTKIPKREMFDQRINLLKSIREKISQKTKIYDIGWVRVNATPLIDSLDHKLHGWIQIYTEFLLKQVRLILSNCAKFEKYLKEGIEKDPSKDPKNRELLMKVMIVLSKHRIVDNRWAANQVFLKDMISLLKDHGVDTKGDDFNAMTDEQNSSFSELFQKVISVKSNMLELQNKETQSLKVRVNDFLERVKVFREDFLKKCPFDYNSRMEKAEIDNSYEILNNFHDKLDQLQAEAKKFNEDEVLFEVVATKFKGIADCKLDIEKLKHLWDAVSIISSAYGDWKETPWKSINIGLFSQENEVFVNMLKMLPKEVKFFKGYQPLSDEVVNMKKVLNCISKLNTDAIQDRHWETLSKEVGHKIDHKAVDFKFKHLSSVNIGKYENQVGELEEVAINEAKIGKALYEMESGWMKRVFEFEMFQQGSNAAISIFKPFDDIQEALDIDTVKVLGLQSKGKSVEFFRERLDTMKSKLYTIGSTIDIWSKVQKNWKRLVNIFLLSEDIRGQLPEATKLFEQKSQQFVEIMREVQTIPIIVEACTTERRAELEEIFKSVEECEKKLNQYLEQKKKSFPRFYFVSNQTLIDILSNGNNIVKISQEYLGDCFDGMKKLKMMTLPSGELSSTAIGMFSKDDELVNFSQDDPFFPCDPIETWLSNLEYKMKYTLKDILMQCKQAADECLSSPDVKDEKNNKWMDWIFKFPAQIALVVLQITWTDDVHKAFDEMEGGMIGAMKDCRDMIKRRITVLIGKVRTNLTREERDKIITLITIDVHSRDVVEKFIAKSISDKESFLWYSQLKFYWSKDATDVLAKQRARFKWEEEKDAQKCIIRIIDWSKFYSFEYVGNCGRLVITPLTDRCYITLTQALSLNMGGAPAGPAGTGKTETTKDLGRAVGLPVFVFNCSDQMSTDSLAQVFMGLSQTGAWGCFDEFNRISIEVLSVVSSQVKSVLDALRSYPPVDKFMFMGEEEINLKDTVGIFITMNPGYSGRTELPDSLKALFRSCAMIVPNLELICENMLMSEGYESAKDLSKKFVALYILSRSLLSKQIHYDWGLRAVKSVLRQAGKLKRQNADIKEEPLLMSALLDFNTPKIVTDDKPIFKKLLEDLFPEQKFIEKPDEKLKNLVAEESKKLKYIPDDTFCIKCVQFSEILEVRHCCFIIGPPGSGKSSVWKVLAAANKRKGEDLEFDTLDPKAVTSNELFGTLSKTKEFKNGVLSSIIKNQCKDLGKYKTSHKHKWTILDGDIDPMWIESLNTVMDDNKVLTLVSQDRFPLTPQMRLIFEVSNLRNATPATVSRAGVLYINDIDIGWKPYMDSWLNSHKLEEIKAAEDLPNYIYKPVFDTTAQAIFIKCQQFLELKELSQIKHVTPTVDIMKIETICTIIDMLCIENKESIANKKDDELKKTAYEGIFFFAGMWGIGGNLIETGEDKIQFDKFCFIWKSQSKVKFPDIQGPDGKNISIFDFYWDCENLAWQQWTIPIYEAPEEFNFTKIFVPNIYTTRIKYLINGHIDRKKPIMLVGNAGTGKTAIIKEYLSSIVDESLTKSTVNFSSKTSSESLQANIMSSGLTKLSMRKWGLGSGKTLIYFIDDINMPWVDPFGTQSPIALIRQIFDYGIVYDRENLEEYNMLQDLYFCGCLNPKAGSFTIDLRLLRHYSIFALPTPNDRVIKDIYKTILQIHFAGFDANLRPVCDKLINATLLIYTKMITDSQLLPTAKKFHYLFNLRELSKVTEGLTMSIPNYYKSGSSFCRLWVNECKRVFEDRLLLEDVPKFRSELQKAYENAQLLEYDKDSKIETSTDVFTTFVAVYEGNEKTYLPHDINYIKKILDEKLAEYNDNKAQMNLVLFSYAVEHICRISRILDRNAGNGLLVGVGGSGKQSLSKLATYIQGYEIETVIVTSSYSANDFKSFLGGLLIRGTKPPGVSRVLLMTDLQIRDDEFLIYINDLLSSGFIPGVYTREDLDSHLMTLKNEAKSLGYKDDPDSLMTYFVDKIRKNVHILLCFSPVGDTMRVRARKFPGIINGTVINWFHGWPKDALVNVAYNFLGEVQFDTNELKEAVALNMAETHTSIEEANKRYLLAEKRYNYTTPKSFLELISFYKELLSVKRESISTQIDVLKNGLNTLAETQEKVKGLEEELKLIMIQVEEKTKSTNALIEVVNVENAKAQEEQKIVTEEENKTIKLADNAKIMADEADAAFLKAEPKRANAMEALGSVKAKDLTDMKALANPPTGCRRVGKVILYLYQKTKVDFNGDGDNDSTWNKFKNLLGNPTKLIQELREWALKESRTLTGPFLEPLKKVIDTGYLDDAELKKASETALKIGIWAKCIIEYNEACREVEPLEEKKRVALAEKDKAEESLKVVKERLRVVNEKCKKLNNDLDEALAQKKKVEDEKERYQNKLDAAAKLVVGLADENTRWKINVSSLTQEKSLCIGDSLLASEFVSYIGAFSAEFRKELWQDKWMPDISQRSIPISPGVEPLMILTTNSKIAKWKNQGLPEDKMSLENAAIITSCKRWPLIIDPQLQGSHWIKGYVDAKAEEKETQEELVRVSFNNDKWMSILQMAISMGKTVIIENVPQDIDPLLNPLLERAIVKKNNRSYVISMGGEDPIDYDLNFMLYLQCKLPNPHFRPEIAAQCTIINFIVTETGLEDQLLALVVNIEKPELEQTKTELVRKQNENEVILSELEKQLLSSLNSANPATILDNKELIENLDKTKKTAKSILEQNEQAKITEKRINTLRDFYRDVAQEGAMLYFLIISLCMVDHMYQYSLESFISFFYKAIRRTTTQEEAQRVIDLRINIRYTIYQWISRGLFERHKIIFLSMLTFRLMQKKVVKVDFENDEMNYLLAGVPKADVENPLKDWLPNQNWGLIMKLSELAEFKKLPESISVELPARFKDWYNELTPEDVKLPSDWRKLEATPFKKLLVLRALRPDRMITALTAFIKNTLPNGEQFVNMDSTTSFNGILLSCLEDGKQESGMNTPIFFILSAGANPVLEVEKIAKKEGFESAKNNWHYISLGQGQDRVAETRLDSGNRDGHWILLQNIHLMPKWLPNLEKRLDGYVKEAGSHTNFRLFLSAEPSKDIPIGLLDRCIKLTNEPPTGLKANMQRAWTYFPKDDVEDKDPRVKSVLFGLCYFHATLTERRKFGPKGWNMMYPFTIGDLYCSYLVLVKNVENNAGKLPWADFRYIFGEIMYGGHIVDDWDRKLCLAYLEYLMAQNLIMDDYELYPFVEGKSISLRTPGQVSYQKYLKHIDECVTYETPLLYGIHPNAEIGLGTKQCVDLFTALIEVQPRGKASASGSGDGIKADQLYISKILEGNWKSSIFNLNEIKDKFTEKGPYQNVFLQECEYMNILLTEIIRSIEELQQGMKGNLTFSEGMEKLQFNLNFERVPEEWSKLAYPAKRSLPTWLDNLTKRIEQLSVWKDDPMVIPKCTRLDYMFNPQSFLTAVLQFSKKDALNKLQINTEFTKKHFEEVDMAAKEGAYVYGFLLEGARWDVGMNQLEESRPKEMFFTMPVVLLRPQVIPQDLEKEDNNYYICPVYRTENRGNTFIFQAQLRTSLKNHPRKWIIAGVAIILDVEGLSDEVRKTGEKK